MPAPSEPQLATLARYDFLVIFIGILVGLSVTKLVAFVGEVISAKKSTLLALTQWVYIVLLFLFQVHYWWSLWDAKLIGSVRFTTYLHLLILPMLMYIATAIVCPKPILKEPHSIDGYFAEKAKIFYVIVQLILLVGAVQGTFLWGQRHLATIIRGIAFALVIPAFFVSSKTYHVALAFALLALFIVYACLFGQTPQAVAP